MTNWKYYFERNGKEEIAALGYEDEGMRDVGTLEEMYQMFKERGEWEKDREHD